MSPYFLQEFSEGLRITDYSKIEGIDWVEVWDIHPLFFYMLIDHILWEFQEVQDGF